MMRLFVQHANRTVIVALQDGDTMSDLVGKCSNKFGDNLPVCFHLCLNVEGHPIIEALDEVRDEDKICIKASEMTTPSASTFPTDLPGKCVHHTKKRAHTPVLFNDFPIDIWQTVIQYMRNRDHLTVSAINKSTRLLFRTMCLTFDKHLDAVTTTRMLSLSTVTTHHFVHHDIVHTMTKDSVPSPKDFTLLTIDPYISKIMDVNFDTVAAGLTKKRLLFSARRTYCRIVRDIIDDYHLNLHVDPKEVDPFCILRAFRLQHKFRFLRHNGLIDHAVDLFLKFHQ
jgi:hypothetical protein